MRRTHDPIVVILRGPPGSGKTSVSLALRDQLVPAARLSIDVLRYMVVPRLLSADQLRVAKLNAARMAIGYASFGISSVIDSVFESAETLLEIGNILDTAGVPHRIFTLKVSIEAALERNARREAFYQTSASRIGEVFESYKWDIGTVVDTTDKLVEEVVEEVTDCLRDIKLARSLRQRGLSKLCVFMRHGTCTLSTDEFRREEDIHLSPEGRAQTRSAARELSSFRPQLIVSSTLTRARESAEIVSQELHMPVSYFSELAERRFLCLEGKQHAEIQSEYSPSFLNNLLHRSETLQIPGEEESAEAQARVIKVVGELMKGSATRVVVLSHGGLHGFLCCGYLQVPIEHCRKLTLDCAHFSVFEFSKDGIFSRLRRLNTLSLDMRYWT